jgi:membrane protease YdiL (CAAX protease family)
MEHTRHLVTVSYLTRLLTGALISLILIATLAPSVAYAAGAVGGGAAAAAARAASPEGNQLEAAASRASETGRKVAMSLIGLGFAIAAVVLAFRRDFKEAVGVFAIGLIAVLLASSTGVRVVENTVHKLFGA